MRDVDITLYSSSFCGACTSTRAVLDRVADLVPAARIREINVAFESDEAERAGITATPTVVIAGADGETSFRASGVPTIDQVLTAVAAAI